MNFGKRKTSSLSISSYDELLRLNLWNYFRQDCFESSEQFNAMKAILQRNQDVVISMPPGSGRSLCYQLPGLMQENKVTIVFCPIKMIRHQLEQLRNHKIGAESPNWSRGTKNDRKKYYRKVVIKDLKTQTPNTRFLYVTPQMASSQTFLNDVESLYQDDKLAYFAVEEAHGISHLGHFRKEYLDLCSFRSAYPSIPWIAIAEITSKEIVDDIVEHLQLYKPIAWFKTPCENIFRKNLYYDVAFEKFDANNFSHLREYVTKCLGYIDYNTKRKTKPCGIIFCRTTEICERVASGLTKKGVTTMPLHERLSTEDRTKVKLNWLAEVFPVISTTVSLSKEIYKPSVRFVVHCEVPESVASYYQESRLAGRDGRSSFSRIYYDRKAVQSIDLFFKNEITNSSNQEKAKRDYDDFLKMCIYCENMECRHKLFSDYFEDESPECTNRCDVCKNPKETRNALDNFQLYSNTCFDAPTPVQDDDSCDGKHSSTSRDNNGQKSIQSKNELNSFPPQPLSTYSSKSRRRDSKIKNHTLIGAFLELHHHSSLNTAESSEQALKSFDNIQKYQKKTSEIGVSSTLTPSQIKVNEEPRSGVQIDLHNFDRISLTFNGQSKKSDASSTSCELFRKKTKRSRNISPTTSARHQKAVTPTRTIIKEEDEEINKYSSDAVGVMIDNKSSFRNDFFGQIPRPPRNLSPAETVIKEENVLPVLTNSFIKSEPISPIIVDRPREWLSGRENQSFIKRERESISKISTSNSKSPSTVYHNVNSTDTIKKRERASPKINSNYSTEREENILENFSENYFPNCASLSEYRIGDKRSTRDRLPSKINDQQSSITRSDEGEKSHKREPDYTRKHEPQHKRQRKQILTNNEFDNRDYESAFSKSIMSADSEATNVEVFEKMVNKPPPVKEHVFHGLIKQIETKYRGQQMPLHFLNMLKTEKALIAELVKTSLMPYYQAGKIQPKDLFSVVARKISHIFYDRYADETIIKKYIDSLFKKIAIVTSIRDLECNL